MISECFAILWKSVSHLVKQHAICAILKILTSQIGFKGNNGIANVPFIFLYLWHIVLQICFTFFHVHCDPFHQPRVLSLCRCFGSTPWLLITYCKFTLTLLSLTVVNLFSVKAWISQMPTPYCKAKRRGTNHRHAFFSALKMQWGF